MYILYKVWYVQTIDFILKTRTQSHGWIQECEHDVYIVGIMERVHFIFVVYSILFIARVEENENLCKIMKCSLLYWK